MKTLSTYYYILEQVEGNLFNVFGHYYERGEEPKILRQVMIHDEVIKGYEKKSHSGYWENVINQTVEQHGKLYEKYKV